MRTSSIRRTSLLVLTAVLLVTMLVACGTIPESTAPSPPTTSPTGLQPTAAATPSPAETTPTSSPPAAPPAESDEFAEATVRPVPAAQWAAMKKAGMVRPECPVQKRSQLRRVDVPYVGFDGTRQRGHLIVRADTAASVGRIFTRLYEMRFPIRRMEGVENYAGDVNESLRADNTSAYNCRRAGQINAPFARSPHANGRAVDINPVENPWKDPRCRCWSPTGKHAKRTTGAGKILADDRVWRLFDEEGWIWQNIKVADYMHFDTGYPSRPYRRPRLGPDSRSGIARTWIPARHPRPRSTRASE